MSQANPLIGPNKSGLTYRQEDNDGKQALLTHHKGPLPPGYAESGTLWLDDASTPWRLCLYDGVDWICLSEVHAGNNTVIPYSGTQPGRALHMVADSGNENACEITMVPPVTSYAAGLTVLMQCLNGNTGLATLAVDGLAPQNIIMPDGSSLPSGALKAGGIYLLCHDGTSFRLLNASQAQGGGILQTASTFYSGSATFAAVIPGDDSIPTSTEGMELMSVSLTPKSATSRMILRVSGVLGASNGAYVSSSLVFNSAPAAIGVSTIHTTAPPGGHPFCVSYVAEHSPGIVTPVTYKARVGTDVAGVSMRPNGLLSMRFMGGLMKWSLVVEEHAQ